jgi:C_GCAxxG_C_C family probable redox protein
MVLKEAFGLPDPLDPSAAMALNGGVAYSGGVCGAISGASLAVGLLASRRFKSHARAKRVAREVIARLMDDFQAEHGAVDCRALVGREIRTPEQHRAFIDSGIWRVTCMSQIEFVVRALAPLPMGKAPT